MSFIANVVPGRIRLAGASQHELPMYNSPPQAPSSFPPRSVAASIHVARQPAELMHETLVPDHTPALQTEDMILLRRRERQLESTLQELLDAQGDALMLGSSDIHSVPSEQDLTSINSGSPPPPQSSTQKLAENHMSKLPSMTPGAARRGIYKSIRELASVKGREEEIAKREARQCRAIQKHLSGWNKKRTSLRQEINSIKSQDARVKERKLQAEADKLRDEITQTEQKLLHMKQRHRALIGEITEIDNLVQSKLTSYTTSLNMLEDDIRLYLATPSLRGRHGQEPLSSLPTDRRTLDMALELVGAEVTSLEKAANTIHTERLALNDGSGLWKTCINKVESFECHLKREMTSLSSINSSASMSDLLNAMDDIIKSVDEDLHLATSNNWNLLIVCIGAELEAFEQGRSILRQAAAVAQEQLQDSQKDLQASEIDRPDEPETVWNTPRASRILVPVDDEDDAPDPELMFSPPAHEDVE